MIKQILGTILFAFSTSSNNFKVPPKKENLTKINGCYNLKNQLFTNVLDTYEAGTSTTITFDTSIDNPGEEPNYLYCDLLRYNGETYFLKSIEMGSSYATSTYMVYATINYYDNFLNEFHTGFNYYNENDVTDLDINIGQMYFYVRKSILATKLQYDLFNSVFTQEENLLTKNYTGYYSYNSTITTLNVNVCMYGTITIGQNMYYSLENNLQSGKYYFEASKYNAQNDTYMFDYLALPFSDTGISNQWYLTGVKMTNDEYNHWQAYGTFGYVPQQNPDAYSFNDLFFSLADTPIYFIYSIFNWQLFGANLFIAFIGLISFALVLLLFRRFL